MLFNKVKQTVNNLLTAHKISIKPNDQNTVGEIDFYDATGKYSSIKGGSVTLQVKSKKIDLDCDELKLNNKNAYTGEVSVGKAMLVIKNGLIMEIKK